MERLRIELDLVLQKKSGGRKSSKIRSLMDKMSKVESEIEAINKIESSSTLRALLSSPPRNKTNIDLGPMDTLISSCILNGELGSNKEGIRKKKCLK